ncbi:zinc finger protein 740 [Platysternon megacephalum]|uniref:Zinc finger protein 740 n=1 Tax=Platysternon megacephalum TaxID=55544 RepID=A0A4D9E529_9SAUR|nr:zinc finger protein 740 [Platysternon megacephalum]
MLAAGCRLKGPISPLPTRGGQSAKLDLHLRPSLAPVQTLSRGAVRAHFAPVSVPAPSAGQREPAPGEFLQEDKASPGYRLALKWKQSPRVIQGVGWRAPFSPGQAGSVSSVEPHGGAWSSMGRANSEGLELGHRWLWDFSMASPWDPWMCLAALPPLRPASRPLCVEPVTSLGS